MKKKKYSSSFIYVVPVFKSVSDIETVPPDLLTLTSACVKLRMTQQPPLHSSKSGTTTISADALPSSLFLSLSLFKSNSDVLSWNLIHSWHEVLCWFFFFPCRTQSLSVYSLPVTFTVSQIHFYSAWLQPLNLCLSLTRGEHDVIMWDFECRYPFSFWPTATSMYVSQFLLILTHKNLLRITRIRI